MVECILNEYRILFISTEIYSLVLRSVYDCHRTVCVFVTLAMSLPVSSIGQSTTSVGGRTKSWTFWRPDWSSHVFDGGSAQGR